MCYTGSVSKRLREAGGLTLQQVIGVATLEGLKTFTTPRQFNYAKSAKFGLGCPKPRLVSEGHRAGVHAVYPIEVIAWCRAVDRLARRGVAFKDMKPLLRKELHRSRGRANSVRTKEKKLRGVEQKWASAVAELFESIPDEPSMEQLQQTVGALLTEGASLDEAIGAEDEFDAAMAHLHRVGRLTWVMHNHSANFQSTELHGFLNMEFKAATLRLRTLCGLGVGRAKPRRRE